MENKNNPLFKKLRTSQEELNYLLHSYEEKSFSQENPCQRRWVKNLSKKHQQYNDIVRNDLEEIRKSYTFFRKKLDIQIKNLKKENKNHSQIDNYFIENQYRELYNLIHNLKSLPSFLLTLEAFKSYSTCQIIAHEKGNTDVSSNYCSEDGKTYTKRMSIDLFNKVFQSIKKSKTPFFNPEQFPPDFSEIIGKFQAKIFVGSRYNLILILGRNDFLPPNQEEIHQFNSVTSHLEPILNAILLRSGQGDKNLSIVDLLDNFPIPTCIRDRTESYLFKNISYENIERDDLKNFDKIEYILTGSNTLSLYFDKQLSEETDLYHFYRVTLLGELLNTLRHELSNPLFGLTLATDIIDTENKDPDIIETISDIKSSAERCQTIIKNFSSLYGDEAHFKEFDLIKVIRETLILTKSATKGIQKDIICQEKEFFLFSNPTWISQIIFNLIINSAQALKEKFPNDLRASRLEIIITINQYNILIHVRDNGPGVSPSIQGKLFNTFFTTKKKGTGLGLSICKNLIHKLDGDISYSNQREGGAQFSISLPLKKI